MAQVFHVILSLSVSGGLIGLLILLIRPATKRLFAKKWTYYLWLLVLVRLMVPVHVSVNVMEHLSVRLSEVWNMQEHGESGAEKGRQEETVKESGAGLTQEKILEADAGNAEENLRESYAVNAEENLHGAAVGVRLFHLAGVLWVFGALAAAAWKLYTYRRFVKSVYADCMIVTDERILAKSAEIQTRLRIGRSVPLYESAAAGSPILIGVRKPRIILSSELLGEMAGRENDICLILHHELVHYKRRDIWYKWLFQAILCVHWFNPLLYLFHRKFHIDCELACDEMVLSLLSQEGRKAYGSVLLDVAETGLAAKPFTVYKNMPAMTLLEERHTLKERLRGIAKYHKKGLVMGLCSVMALAVLVTAAVICGVTGIPSGSREIVLLQNGGGAGQEQKRAESGIADETESIGRLPEIGRVESSTGLIAGAPMVVNSGKDSDRMYDEDALIAGESSHDIWRVQLYKGGGQNIEARQLQLNGSDILWIMYADQDTTLEIESSFTIKDGRFKVVQILPDTTVRVLNESGEKTSQEVNLPAGRNCFKIVGQKARLKDLDVAYGGAGKRDLSGVYRSEDEEYAYLVQNGAAPLDMSRLEDVCIYLEDEYVSGLCRTIWDKGEVLTEDNWQNLFIYSDMDLTSRYLLEALEAGKIEEFDSKILIEIACYMSGENVSACFRCLLERGKVLASDWEDMFIYSDSELSAKYLAEAIQNGNGNGFDGKALEQISVQISAEDLTDIVLALGRDELSYDDLKDYVLPYLGEKQVVQCVNHYIGLGNSLTDAQLREIEGYVSDRSFYRIVEENGKFK